MSRYIDADLAKDKIEERLLFRAKDVERLLDDTPTADVEPVRHASWHFIDANENGDFYSVCSYCQDTRLDFVSNYCPNCGAKMDGKK